MHARGEIRTGGLAVLGNHDTKAALRANALDNLVDVQSERGSEQKCRSPECLQDLIKALRIAALRNNAEVIFHGENFCRSRTEYSLIVCQDYLVHAHSHPCCKMPRPGARVRGTRRNDRLQAGAAIHAY